MSTVNLRVALVGFTAGRAKRLAATVQGAMSLGLEATNLSAAKADPAGLAATFDAVFVSTELGPRRLAALVADLRRESAHTPIVITYGAEPGGKIFQLAATLDCWLFSEIDRLERGLTPDELAEELQERKEASEMGSRLMEISLLSGPCSTGD